MLSAAGFADDGNSGARGKTIDDGRPFGVCSHPFAPREINIRKRLFDKMREANVQWLRTDFGWNVIEKQRGNYDFKVHDEIADALAARDIKVLGILTESRPNQNCINGEDRQDWLEYVAATVAHFKGRVSHWEILNEHDAGKISDKKYAAEYGRVLKAAAQTIRKANPEAVILYGGLALTNAAYVENTLRECPTDNFDIMNFHCYPAPKPPESVLEENISKLKRAMDKFGGRKPIWLTETGATTPDQVAGANMIRAVSRKMGLDERKVAAISDGTTDSSSEARFLFPEAKKIRKIPFSKIGELDENYVLVLPTTQEFPYSHLQGLESFVKIGGAAIHCGGFPLYFDSDGKAKGGIEGINRLGANLKPHWDFSPALPATADLKKVKNLKTYQNLPPEDFNKSIRCFDFNTEKSPEGTEFVPLISFEINGQTITPAAAYKFPNGGAFISVADRTSTRVSEKFQAAQLVKIYLYALSRGVEKVFNYNFRSHGEVSIFEGAYGLVRRDMSEKPAFAAYQTLTKLVGRYPKITYSKNGNICRADWISPDAAPVCALWTFDGKPAKTLITLGSGEYKIEEIGGKTLKKGFSETQTQLEKKIGIVPFYIIGARVKAAESAAPEK